MGVPNSVSSWQESIYLPTKLTVIFFRIIKINQIRPFVLVHVVASRSSGSQIILHLQLSNLHVGVLPLFPSCPISRYDAFQNLLMAIRKNPLSLISSLNTSFTIFPWRRKWQPTPVFLPGESHAKRSPVGYSPQSHKELDLTEQLTLSHFHHLTLRTNFPVEELLLLQTLKYRLQVWRGRGKLPFLPLTAMSCHSPSFC